MITVMQSVGWCVHSHSVGAQNFPEMTDHMILKLSHSFSAGYVVTLLLFLLFLFTFKTYIFFYFIYLFF